LSPTFNNTISQTSPGCRHHITVMPESVRWIDVMGDLIVRDTTGLLDRSFSTVRGWPANKCADDVPDRGLAGR